MVWFVTMIAGVLGLYAKGHQWASRKNENPVVTSVSALSTQVSDLTDTISSYAQELHDVADRVSVLERNGEVKTKDNG